MLQRSLSRPAAAWFIVSSAPLAAPPVSVHRSGCSGRGWIESCQDGLVITLVSNEGEIERLLLEVDADPNIGVDWIRASCIWQETG